MSGPCAKRSVRCIIWCRDGEAVLGTNDCENPQPLCPRLPGEGYEKCASICQQKGHAEIQALRAAGERARGATAHIIGHDHCCAECTEAMMRAGIDSVTIFL